MANKLSEYQNVKPNDFFFYSEGLRSTYEMALLETVTLPLLKHSQHMHPLGNGEPVLVIPGFLADDHSTKSLRNYLSSIGYNVHGWSLGTNKGARDELFEQCLIRIGELHEQYGQKISIIGQSLGGIFARELAKLSPHISKVICLGTPADRRHGNPSRISALYDLMNPETEENSTEELVQQVSEAPKVPCTMVFSKEDGVVSWQACTQKDPIDDTSENIRVYGSHGGMGFNAAIYYLIADRLAQKCEKWQPFKAPIWIQSAYPQH